MNHTEKSALGAGRPFLKDYMKKVQKDAFSELPNSADSIGAATSTPKLKKVRGTGRRTRSY
jgi:hypothetical protein